VEAVRDPSALSHTMWTLDAAAVLAAGVAAAEALTGRDAAAVQLRAVKGNPAGTAAAAAAAGTDTMKGTTSMRLSTTAAIVIAAILALDPAHRPAPLRALVLDAVAPQSDKTVTRRQPNPPEKRASLRMTMSLSLMKTLGRSSQTLVVTEL